MTTAASCLTSTSIIEAANLSLAYAKMALEGISPDKFARIPEGVNVNHPAFNFGHLAYYIDQGMLASLGKEDLAIPSEDWGKLFSHEATCQDDPDGTIYPPMDEIVNRFFDRTNLLLEQIAVADEATLSQGLPEGSFFADYCTSLASVLNFMLSSHTMMHLGQVSAWRRMMGLGQCMPM